MPTTIVITMAGLGSRFRAAGYAVPKYEIEAKGKTLFDWSLTSLANFIGADTRVVFVCLAENQSKPFVTRRCNELGIEDFHVVEIPALTDGQATSAYISRAAWLGDSSLMIYNIDTYVEPSSLRPEMIASDADGWIPCVKVPGDHWSFVRLNDLGYADLVTEKKRISDLASIGLYWFRRASDFTTAYELNFEESSRLVNGERYIAPLYNTLIERGCRITASAIPAHTVHVLGTPAELDIFLRDKTIPG